MKASVKYLTVLLLALLVGIAYSKDTKDDEGKPIPHLKDETSSVEIETHPEKYVGKSFIICGGVEMGNAAVSFPPDVRQFGYTEGTYYPLEFREMGKDTNTYTGQALVSIQGPYLKKQFGEAIAETITKFQAEQGKLGKRTLELLRVKATLVRGQYRVAGDAIGGPTNVMIVLDAQPCKQDMSGWEPWMIESKVAKEKEAAAKEAETAQKATEERKKVEAAKKAAEEEAKWRTWTDASGGHTIHAKFGGLIAGKVKLVKDDDTTIKVPLEKLSDEDQEWIKNRKR